MGRWGRAMIFLALTQSLVYATKLSSKEYHRFTNTALETRDYEKRAETNPYINIVKGLFNSREASIGKDLAEIPCSTIQTLETDEQQAEQFVTDIQNGNVPQILSTLSQDVISQFSDLINIAESLPTAIIDFGQAVETDAVNIFDDIEDGSITSVLEALPSEIFAAVTSGWADLTDGLTDAWHGFECDVFDDCPSVTPDQGNTCGTPAAVAAATTNALSQGPAILTTAYATAAATTDAAAASNAAAWSEYYVESSEYAAYTAAAASSTALASVAAAEASRESAESAAAHQQTEQTMPTGIAPQTTPVVALTNTPATIQSPIQSKAQTTQQGSTQDGAEASAASISLLWANTGVLTFAALGVLGAALWL